MRLNFRAKLYAIVAVNALALLVLVVTSSVIAGRVNDSITDIRDRYVPRIGLKPRLQGGLERTSRSLQDAVSATDADQLAEAERVHRAHVDDISTTLGGLTAGEIAALHLAVDDYWTTAVDVSRRLIAGETGESVVAAMRAMQDKQARAASLIEEVSRFDEAELAHAFTAAADAQATASQVRLVISGVCLVLVLGLSVWISRNLFRNLGTLTAGLARFGKGDFAEPIPLAGSDELAAVAREANQMAQRLDRLGSERARGDWLKAGLAGLDDELRGELTPAEVGDRVVGFLARYLEAPVAAMYVLGSDDRLALLGAHGMADRSAAAAGFARGDGLVGQAIRTLEPTVIDDLPPGYLRIRSGLGEGAPRAVVFLPLAMAGQVTGVVELAVLRPWTEAHAELLLTVRDTVSIAVEVAHSRAAARALLAETQRQAAELLEARRGIERKAEELARASAYKSQFLANMSHELRTPLNAILGFSELMYDGVVGPDSPEHKEFLGDILASGRHLLQLINDVLDLSKVEAGKLEFHPEPVAPAQVVGEVLAILRTTAASKQIRIDLQLDPALGEMVVDPARLKQVLYNYLSNAIKFTPEGGRVSVRVLPEGDDQIRFEVEDTGIGIAAADLDRLFVEFQQIRSDGAQRQPGTGLGLALVKRMIEAQQGSVGVRSTPGRGSVFHAVLPRLAVTPEAAPSPPTRAAPPGTPAILVIEDNAGDQQRLVDGLERAGYAVEVAATGAQALACSRERSFAAITLDLLLPDMSGLEVLQQIRADGPNRDVPIIVITVVAERGAVAGFAVHDILPKPLDNGSLLAALLRAGVTPSPTGTVLVVDDDPASLKLMSRTLVQLGYRTHCEADAERALRAAQDAPPSAIVLDLMMPGMNGFEFLDRLRRDPGGRRIPVIVWTVADLSQEEHGRLRASASAVVSKGNGGSAAVVAELAAFLPRPAAELR